VSLNINTELFHISQQQRLGQVTECDLPEHFKTCSSSIKRCPVAVLEDISLWSNYNCLYNSIWVFPCIPIFVSIISSPSNPSVQIPFSSQSKTRHASPSSHFTPSGPSKKYQCSVCRYEIGNVGLRYTKYLSILIHRNIITDIKLLPVLRIVFHLLTL
jgi:hypothetical protein